MENKVIDIIMEKGRWKCLTLIFTQRELIISDVVVKDRKLTCGIHTLPLALPTSLLMGGDHYRSKCVIYRALKCSRSCPHMPQPGNTSMTFTDSSYTLHIWPMLLYNTMGFKPSKTTLDIALLFSLGINATVSLKHFEQVHKSISKGFIISCNHSKVPSECQTQSTCRQCLPSLNYPVSD